MSNTWIAGVIWFGTGMFFGAWLVFVVDVIPLTNKQTHMTHAAINAGAGFYHPQTGEFQFGCTGGTR